MRPLNPDDYADADETNPGLPACTIIGPLLTERAPAKPARIPYHLRYPPVIDDPIEIAVLIVVGEPQPEAVDHFEGSEIVSDLDYTEQFALGSYPKGRNP